MIGSYQSKGASAANPYSNSKGITFSGSGELDNGFNVSTGYTMTNAAFSTSYVSLDMGDSGTLHFMNGTSKALLVPFMKCNVPLSPISNDT